MIALQVLESIAGEFYPFASHGVFSAINTQKALDRLCENYQYSINKDGNIAFYFDDHSVITNVRMNDFVARYERGDN